jgi:hypothetical protein
MLKLEPTLIQKFDLSPIFGLKSLDKLFDQPVRHPISPPHTISQPDYFIICQQGVVCVRMRGNFYISHISHLYTAPPLISLQQSHSSPARGPVHRGK